MSKSSKMLILAGVLCLSAACNKVDPLVMSLASGNGEGEASSAKFGRVTLGSDEKVLIDGSGTYKLKGRISTIEPVTTAPPASSPYKLTGTVRFQ